MIMNVLPVLKEITDALEQLLQGGAPHFIYTNKMPFSPEDIQLLSEFTPILEIVEINWYPQVVAFPPEDVAQGVRQFLTAVAEVTQIPPSVKQQLHQELQGVSPEKEIRWNLEGEWESLLHYVLAPGSLSITSPTVRITATRFWGVWLIGSFFDRWAYSRTICGW